MKKIFLFLIFLGILNFCQSDINYNEAQNRFKSGDFELSIKLLEKSCENNFAKSCATLGSIYYVGYMIEKDANKSITYFLKACKNGEKSSCSLENNVKSITKNSSK